ncbi:MAG: Hsp20/alpha crystallin family protein [Phycisphaerae bacterium]|nr:Hsp20/alpha crystallin family protein [Phycisphaerae bacterium]
MATFRWPNGWDPLAGFRTMQRELEKLSGRTVGAARGIGGGVYPPVNVLIGLGEIIVECEVAGMNRDELDLSITGETLKITGTKKPATQEPAEGESACRYHRRERGMGDFSRTIVLPEKVDADRISASLETGILTIRLPKFETVAPRHIEVS